MSRNRYDAEFGVCRVRWHRDEPPGDGQPCLVEVWRASVDENLIYGEPTKPRVQVRATVEVRFYRDSKWWRLGYLGSVTEVEKGTQVRRWARIPGPRWWGATIALENWTPADGETRNG